MRFSKIIEIIKVFFTFLKREVLNFGILKSKGVRVAVLSILFVLITVMTAMLYSFFEINESTREQTQIVLDTYSCSVLMYTLLAFLFIKILFIKKQNLILFTQQMPVTRRELNISILFFEIALSLLIVAVLSSSMILSLIIREGTTFALRLICNLFFPCIIGYLVFQLGYAVLNWICIFFKLKRIKDVLIICTLSVFMFVFYIIIVPGIFDNIIFGYIDGKETSAYLFFTVLMEKYGFVCAAAFFFISVIILGTLIIMCPNKDFSEPNRFIRVYNTGAGINLFKSYTLAYLRNTDTYSYYFIALFICAMMCFSDIEKSYYALAILTMNGIYAYIQTEDLRYILLQKNYSVLKDYLLLILSQIYYVLMLGLPMMGLCVVIDKSLLSLIELLITNLFGIILFTLLGIIFPPKNENPFSVFTGFMVVLAISILVGMTFLLLDLTGSMIAIAACCILVLSVGISLMGLSKMKRIKRQKNTCFF